MERNGEWIWMEGPFGDPEPVVEYSGKRGFPEMTLVPLKPFLRDLGDTEALDALLRELLDRALALVFPDSSD